MKVTHLYHSGVLIENETHQLFFDAISDINQHVDFGKEIYFFATHSHSDHFDPVIFSYHGDHVHYILSDDIKEHPKSNYMRVKPDMTYAYRQLEINTYKSTDRGVAFIIEFEGVKIFHAGDLNWWHWEGDDEATQLKEGMDYKEIIDTIPFRKIDIACLPVDPRLGEHYHLAADYLLDTLEVTYLVPLHFRSHFEITKALKDHRHQDERLVVVKDRDQVIIEF